MSIPSEITKAIAERIPGEFLGEFLEGSLEVCEGIHEEIME